MSSKLIKCTYQRNFMYFLNSVKFTSSNLKNYELKADKIHLPCCFSVVCERISVFFIKKKREILMTSCVLKSNEIHELETDEIQ